MPPVLVAFFILIGAMTGPPLVKGFVTPRDPSARPKWGKPAADEYRAWTSRPWAAVAERRAPTCDVRFFALSTRREPVRLVAGGVEQLLDTSWTFDRAVPTGERRTIALEFRDPVGGALLACREASVACFPYGMEGMEAVEVREGGECPEPEGRGRKAEREERLALKGSDSGFVPMDIGIGGAFVDVTFELVGRVTEEWYCPRLDVTWPEGTHSVRESDCPPFPGDPDRRFRWTLNHGFAPGTWKVRGCVSKADEVLACQDATVRVVGGEQ